MVSLRKMRDAEERGGGREGGKEGGRKEGGRMGETERERDR